MADSHLEYGRLERGSAGERFTEDPVSAVTCGSVVVAVFRLRVVTSSAGRNVSPRASHTVMETCCRQVTCVGGGLLGMCVLGVCESYFVSCVL